MLLASCTFPLPLPVRTTADRIVSTNPCLDAILVQLVDPARIAAISAYSQDPRSSSMPVALANRLKATAGTAEEVVALRPDLVLASSFTPAATRAALDRIGARTLVFGAADTIADNRAQIAEIAAAVGAPRRGAALIARIDVALARSAAPAGAPVPALLFHGGSAMVSGSGTLIDELLRHTGFANMSARFGLQHTGFLPLERVALEPPRVILSPLPAVGVGEEARSLTLRHRIVERSRGRTVEADFPERLFFCGGPTIIPAVERLAAIRRQLPR